MRLVGTETKSRVAIVGAASPLSVKSADAMTPQYEERHAEKGRTGAEERKGNGSKEMEEP